MDSELRIGELALAAGVSTDTVRYYERVKLIPRPARSRSGYRTYSNRDVERLQFIKRAKSLGLSLDEIRALLPERHAGLSECRQVKDLLVAKLAELDTRIAEMREFRETLNGYLEECHAALAEKRGDRCPVLFGIEIPDSKSRKRSKKRGEKT